MLVAILGRDRFRKVAIGLLASVIVGAYPAHVDAQSGNRNAAPRIRRPRTPTPRATTRPGAPQRQYGAPTRPPSFPGTNVPRTRNEPTSPRLDQFRTMQRSNSATQRRNRPESTRPRSFQSGPLPTTGLNATRSIAPDTRLIPNLRYRSPNSKSSAETNLADGAVAHDENIEVHFDAAEHELQLRRWVDNTGTFSTVGRLVAVLGNNVRLMKENGRTATFPVRRLSDDDLQYVEQQLSASSERESS